MSQPTVPSPASAAAPPPIASPLAGTDAPATLYPPVPPLTPSRALGRTFVNGMIFSTLALVLGKFSSFIATIFLGTIFGSHEYGVYAAALSAAMVGDVLTDGGLRRVLITRGHEYHRIARTSFYIALAFNCLGCLLMFRAAGWYREDRPDAVGPLVVTGLALALSTIGTVQKARQSIDMKFGQIAFMGTISSFLRNLATVLFAWLFMRVWNVPEYAAMAFALPLLLVNLWEAAYVYKHVGRIPPSPFDPKLAIELVHQGKWVIFAMMGGALIYRGDYLVASNMLPTGGAIDISGQYMFAFQLTVSLFAPLSIGMAAVIQPVMAQLRDEPERQAGAFLRMVRTALFFAVPAAMGAVCVTPLMVYLLWPNKPEWHACVPAIQLLAATEAIRHLHHMCLATIDARGQWKHSATLIAIDGVLVIVAAFIGCWIGTLMALTIAVAAERTVLAIIQTIYTYRLTGGKARVVMLQVWPPVLIGLPLALGALWIAHASVDSPQHQRWMLFVLSIPILIAFTLVARILTPARYAEASDLILSRFRRSRPDPSPVG
jgi:O-antigen/teichoic acid export membrane protein